MGERRDGVATAGHRDELAGLGARRDVTGDLDRAVVEGLDLEAPSGPFQTTVAASSMAPLMRSIDCGPISRIMPSVGIASRP